MAEIRRIESEEALDEIFDTSSSRPVWIFKHSLICSISRRAWKEYRGFAEARGEGEALFTVVEIQNARAVSAAIAERTGVRHESPQALLLAVGEVAWHGSHFDITGTNLASAESG